MERVNELRKRTSERANQGKAANESQSTVRVIGPVQTTERMSKERDASETESD